jgi:hypothetical protein
MAVLRGVSKRTRRPNGVDTPQNRTARAAGLGLKTDADEKGLGVMKAEISRDSGTACPASLPSARSRHGWRCGEDRWKTAPGDRGPRCAAGFLATRGLGAAGL